MKAERSFEKSETDYPVMRPPVPEKKSSNFFYFYSCWHIIVACDSAYFSWQPDFSNSTELLYSISGGVNPLKPNSICTNCQV